MAAIWLHDKDGAERIKYEIEATRQRDTGFLSILRKDLLLNVYTAPESNMPSDLLCRLFRRAIGPGNILVHLVSDSDVIITGSPFPGASRRLVTLLQMVIADRCWRKIHASFHTLLFVFRRFGDHCAMKRTGAARFRTARRALFQLGGKRRDCPQ
jgi:hypothetical protein